MTKYTWEYPWTSSFKKRKELTVVLDNLARLGYPIPERKKAPDGRVLKIYELLLDKLVTKEVPWVIAMSNSSALLQAIANVIPVTWALTTMASCYTVSTSGMVDLFWARRPSSDFAPDPAGEAMYEITAAGLLVWEEVSDQASGASKQTGKFSAMLRYRMLHKLPTLLLSQYQPPFEQKIMDGLFVLFKENFGVASAEMLKQNVHTFNFEVPVGDAPPIETVEV